jgi:hypothetical protein
LTPSGYDADGYFARLRLPEAAGALVDQALKAAYEDLKHQAKTAAADGGVPEPVYVADAVVAVAESYLRHGQAARPGTDRYLVHLHVEAGPGGVELATHLGIVVPDSQRRHLLCDARVRSLVHDPDTGAPLSVGRTTRVINRRLRRAVEHRDGGRCAVPGCGRATSLEIHHIIHWEDGGPTDTSNLITICSHHHRCHHQHTLGIDGNADLPRHTTPGVVFTDRWDHPLDPTGQPVRPTPAPAGTTPTAHITNTAAGIGINPHTYIPPTGERLDRWGFHLNENGPDWLATATATNGDTAADDDDPPPPPDITGHRPPAAPPDPAGPASGTPTDPTRAGPTVD